MAKVNTDAVGSSTKEEYKKRYEVRNFVKGPTIHVKQDLSTRNKAVKKEHSRVPFAVVCHSLGNNAICH